MVSKSSERTTYLKVDPKTGLVHIKGQSIEHLQTAYRSNRNHDIKKLYEENKLTDPSPELNEVIAITEYLHQERENNGINKLKWTAHLWLKRFGFPSQFTHTVHTSEEATDVQVMIEKGLIGYHKLNIGLVASVIVERKEGRIQNVN